MAIIKQYKKNRKIVCYITKDSKGTFKVCTGKPSDVSCISWSYTDIKDAEFTANEYFNNRVNFLK